MHDHSANICGECGYDLTGLAARSEFGICPECGTRYVNAFPLRLEAWPAWWLMAARMCLPTAVLVGCVAVLSQFRGGQMFLLMAIPLLAMAWVLIAVAIPVWVGCVVARNCVLRARRGRVLGIVAGSGLVMNVVMTVVGLAVVLKG